ncbi:MAG: sulfate ABC transporter substrate-binding protein [Chthoniobacterales bacterium]
MAFSTLLMAHGASAAPQRILNVSYDVSREFYKNYNDWFQGYWKEKKNQPIAVDQSHDGSSKQVRAVLDELDADVVTMNQDTDIQVLHDRGKLVVADWKKQFPNGSAPYSSTIIFLVRKGNPKGIRDWDDLIKPGVSVIVPNPKTSGNGRYSYLAAWAHALKQSGGNEEKARQFVKELFAHVPVLETGGRAATTTFIEKGIGDVLLTFESEILLITKQFKPDGYDVVIPSDSILAEAPVAVVDVNVDRHGTREVATEYLANLWSPQAQQIAVKNFFRPQSEEVLAANAALFPKLTLYKIDDIFGSWGNAQKTHFDDGGLFDQIYNTH